MQAVIEDVVVDSEQFPITYQVRDRIRRMAYHFKSPIKDALQECMMLEHSRRDYFNQKTYVARKDKGRKRPSVHKCDPKAALLQCIRFKMLSEIKARQDGRGIVYENELPEGIQGVYEGYGVVFTRKDLYNKILVSELKSMLSKVDEELAEIAEAQIKHIELSWSQIYQKEFRRRMSHGTFFARVAHIRRVGTKVRDRLRQRYEALGSPSFSVTMKSINEVIYGRYDTRCHA